VISNSDGDGVGGHLGSNLSWGINDTLDNWDMGHSVGSCERKSSNWKASIWESSNQLRISLGLTLGNDMSSSESVVWESQAISVSSIGRGSKDGSHRWVVDERGGGGDHSGGSSKDGGISLGITLGNHVSSGEHTSETSIPSIGETSISKSRGSKDGPDRWVVDERGGGGDHSGGSGEDGGVSLGRPLAVESESVISNSNRDSVGSNLGGNFCGGDLNILYNWDMGYSMSSG